ncbi:uncharacterized protein N7459_005811 [Penicillium hispanicum]|uniref:uncharacterized protein n=1 Tax=Penicillium hispanicum TaxID=1080232 RepID=UPI002541E91F|nr:uncharacterized protein N7459_005811 [Penicillium hispanicum]KAJ5579826.1 hypothetical protein N7459_005811 [Penicillium hispanicum]
MFLAFQREDNAESPSPRKEIEQHESAYTPRMTRRSDSQTSSRQVCHVRHDTRDHGCLRVGTEVTNPYDSVTGESGEDVERGAAPPISVGGWTLGPRTWKALGHPGSQLTLG